MLDCHIVKDLLPSYIEGLVSQKTERAVSEHLQNCEDCKSLHEQLKAPMDNFSPQSGKKEIDFLKKIRAGTTKKLVTGFCAMLLVFAALIYFFAIGWPADKADITYTTRVVGEEWHMDIELTNGKELLVRTEPIYGDENKAGIRPVVGFLLKPYEVLPSPMMEGDSTTFMYGCQVNSFKEHDFKIVLRLGDGDVVFSSKNFQQQP